MTNSMTEPRSCSTKAATMNGPAPCWFQGASTTLVGATDSTPAVRDLAHRHREGLPGDDDRLRQQFRLAGLNRDRTLAHDVARTEALLAKHVLSIRIVVLRYTKALLLLIVRTVVMLAASGIVEEALHDDPSGGRFADGFPYRHLFLVACLVYVAWAPAAVRSVTAPLRMIQRHTPGVGEHRDVYLDKQLTQFESATVLATFVVLVGAVAACSSPWIQTAGTAGLWLGITFGGLGVGLWGTPSLSLATPLAPARR